MIYKQYNGYFLEGEYYYDVTEGCYLPAEEEPERKTISIRFEEDEELLKFYEEIGF